MSLDHTTAPASGQGGVVFGRASECRMKLVIASLVSAAALTAVAGSAQELLSHRAVYELRLGATRNASGISEMTGRMVTEWAETCDGYTLNQRTVTVGRGGDGEPVENDYSVASWESKDGLVFRFDTRNMVNGEMQEEFSGKAELDGPGQGGHANFRKPSGESVELPPGTLFPTEHTKVLLARAAAGDSVVTRTLFDGSGTDGLFEATAFISPGFAVPADGKFEPLRKLKGLPIRLAFFHVNDKEAAPAYEVGGPLYTNGVSGDMTIDYREFTLIGELVRLEPLPRPGC
jgi:hypothetical protein